MKRYIGFLVVLLCVVGLASADSYTYSLTITNGQAATLSAALPISGWLDRVEIRQDNPATSAVYVATYDGTTAVDTFVSLATLTTGQKVVRPRFIGTGNDGTALSGVAAQYAAGKFALSTASADGTNLTSITCSYSPSNTVVTTVLQAPYERAMIGGNLKVSIGSAGGGNDGSNPVDVTIFYDRTAR